jgi:PHS family inorganic phosphate transporter-like MFS transporter
MAGKHEGDPDELRRAQALAQSDQLAVPKASWTDFFRHNSQWKNGKILLGTAGSWFCLDIAYYGLSLNTATVLAAIGYTTGPNVYEILRKTSIGNIIIVCAGAIPGYWTTVATVDTVGRKPIQLGSFIILTILFVIWGFDYNNISSKAMLGIYCICNFFFNFGPNATTFIVPGECFPTRYRSTSHGISAGSGKIGSIIGQAGFARLASRGAKAGSTGRAASPWQNHVMQIYALFMLIGCFTTLCIPETARRTLEALSGDEPNLTNPPVERPSIENGENGKNGLKEPTNGTEAI